jgi:signal transduction histidine kinase
MTLSLERYVKARLLPLCVLLFFVVGSSAPTAFFLMRFRQRRLQARVAAQKLSGLLHRDARALPGLWLYNTPKLINHLRSYGRQSGVRRIVVTDSRNRPVGDSGKVAGGDGDDDLLWASAPVSVDGRAVGKVWVALGFSPRGALLFFLFGGLGLALALLMYWIPIRAVRTADQRVSSLVSELSSSRGALAELNETLEQKVAARSAELERANRELKIEEGRVRELSTKALELQEAERRAIARELHDEAGQALTAIRINLQLLCEQTERSGPTAELAAKTVALVDETLEEIRRLVRRLGPAVLDEVGLSESIRRLGHGLARRTGAEVEVRLPDGPVELPGPVETGLYRIAQEALTNVSRHAEASRVDVSIDQRAGRLVLSVVDDGEGFRPGGARKGEGSGLAGMRERAELLGGKLEVFSRPGCGTEVRVSLDHGLGTEVGSQAAEADREALR